MSVLEIPLDLPLGVELAVEEGAANRELDEARAIGESYGVTVIPRLVRGRSAAPRSCGGGAARRRGDRHRRAAQGSESWPARALRAHCRLRAQERALPRPGDGDDRGRRVNLYRGAVAVLALAFVGHRRAPRRDRGGGRRRARLRARRALRRAWRRPAHAAPEGRPLVVAADGEEAARLPARARRAGPVSSPTARSPRRCTSRWGSWPPTPSLTPLVLLGGGVFFLIVAPRTPRERRRSPRRAVRRPSSAARSTTWPASSPAGRSSSTT